MFQNAQIRWSFQINRQDIAAAGYALFLVSIVLPSYVFFNYMVAAIFLMILPFYMIQDIAEDIGKKIFLILKPILFSLWMFFQHPEGTEYAPSWRVFMKRLCLVFLLGVFVMYLGLPPLFLFGILTHSNVNNEVKKPKCQTPEKFVAEKTSEIAIPEKVVHISDLPLELLLHIFTFLDAKNLCEVSKVSSVWRKLSQDNTLWKRLVYQQMKEKNKNFHLIKNSCIPWKQLYINNCICPQTIKTRASNCDVLIIIHNKVYDVTHFLEEHPGGEEILLKYAGKDATEAFEEVDHSPLALNLLQEYEIGPLQFAKKRKLLPGFDQFHPKPNPITYPPLLIRFFLALDATTPITTLLFLFGNSTFLYVYQGLMNGWGL